MVLAGIYANKPLSPSSSDAKKSGLRDNKFTDTLCTRMHNVWRANRVIFY